MSTLTVRVLLDDLAAIIQTYIDEDQRDVNIGMLRCVAPYLNIHYFPTATYRVE